MANGRAKQTRIEALNLIVLAFHDGLDTRRFLETGMIAESNVGKPIQLTPEEEAAVQAEIDRIRKENPDLPTIPVIR